MLRKLIQHILKPIAKGVLWRYQPRIVAITGSVGKSSTKEAIFRVLDYTFPGEVRRSEFNLNTEIGVPLTIIGGVDARRNIAKWLFNFIKGVVLIFFPFRYPKILILEMAADRPGDIFYLTSIVRPDIAVITAIGQMPAHLEFFLSRESYIKEKCQLVRALKMGGAAILNYDDEAVREMNKYLPEGREFRFYGMREESDFFASNISYTFPSGPEEIENTGVSFKVTAGGSTVPFKILGALGQGVVYTALAAVAVGKEMGVNLVKSAEALKGFKPLKARMNFIKGIKNTIIIDDTYNASPLSTKEALNVLSGFQTKRRVAVLGDIRELGPNKEKAHRLLAGWARDAADIIFLVGEAVVFTREELGKKSFSGKPPRFSDSTSEVEGRSDKIFHFKTGEEAKDKIKEILEEGDVVLIKGSRAVKMEAIVEEII